MNRKEYTRVRQIVTHPHYQQEFSALQRAEQNTIYCNHTIEHFLDVARICYILVLEDGAQFSRELIYATALLHDLGRYRQIIEGVPHEKVSAVLAEEILADCGFAEAERKEVARAILYHRHHSAEELSMASVAECNAKDFAKNSLGYYLYRADKQSRLCFCCVASNSCKWSEKEKNKGIVL